MNALLRPAMMLTCYLLALPLHGTELGEFNGSVRYRVEHVDDSVNRDALASTVRASASYRSPDWRGFSAFGELEHISVVGSERFNDGGSNGITDRAVVVDPEGTEINQAYVDYNGFANTKIRYGRQTINHRKAPLNRFLGNVIWRQNHQSFDGMNIHYTGLEDTSLEVAYLYNVNRIFGEDNPISLRRDLRLNGITARAEYRGWERVKLEAYLYDLDFDDANALSSRTFGVRASGKWAASAQFKGIYTLEMAHQSDTGSNPNRLSANYLLAEIGLVKPEWHNLTLKLSQERLPGNGTAAFQTPLATLHAFQGWADKFLSTPADGLEDTYLTLKMKLGRFNLLAAQHDFRAENSSTRFGREFNVQLTTKALERVGIGVKAAFYEGRRSAPGALAIDTTKLWGWVQWRF